MAHKKRKTRVCLKKATIVSKSDSRSCEDKLAKEEKKRLRNFNKLKNDKRKPKRRLTLRPSKRSVRFVWWRSNSKILLERHLISSNHRDWNIVWRWEDPQKVNRSSRELPWVRRKTKRSSTGGCSTLKFISEAGDIFLSYNKESTAIHFRRRYWKLVWITKKEFTVLFCEKKDSQFSPIESHIQTHLCLQGTTVVFSAQHHQPVTVTEIYHTYNYVNWIVIHWITWIGLPE